MKVKFSSSFMKRFLTPLLLTGLFLLTTVSWADDNLYVFRSGTLAYVGDTAQIDSIAIESDNTQMTIYSKDKQVLYTAPTAEIDSITFRYWKPEADMLDVVFHSDGTAEDVSPMHNEVKTIAGGGSSTYFNNTYGRFTAHFTNSWGGTATGYYRVDYADNTDFQSKLADGHTLELLFAPHYEGTIPNAEAKCFSSHQSGGTGFLISKQSGSRKNEITFLPNVNTTTKSSWKWATSGIVPESDTYYHIVGVWNKSESLAYIYVNGVLKNKVAAKGNFIFPSSACYWFGIGADPSTATVANTSMPGDVVLARIYDAPLEQKDVTALWQEVQYEQSNVQPDLVSSVSYMTGAAVVGGKTYPITGQGFEAGDQIQFTSLADGSVVYSSEITLSGDQTALVTIPSDFASGRYRLILTRGEVKQDLGVDSLVMMTTAPRGAQVIAHRGYWNGTGAAQNSRASLRGALNLGVYGSETDVWLTSDDSIMVNHDASLNGVNIQNSTYSQVKELTLSNGEYIPQLSDFLAIMDTTSSPTKLIIEIKKHSTTTRNQEAATRVVNAVKAAGLQGKVEYISFSLDACKQIAIEDPTAKVAYLNGDISPAQLHTYGITGIDYTQAKTVADPTWISQAHGLGMTVNVWTIDETSQIVEVNNEDADYVTTNNPVEAKSIYQYYQSLK